MKVLLLQLDGKYPNLALMRLAKHHRSRGDQVELRVTANPDRHIWDSPDKVYASAIFRVTIPIVERLLKAYPDAIYGGTAVDPLRKGEEIPASPIMRVKDTSLESIGVASEELDYSDYPRFRQSIGFTQRGCRLKCPFCVVPRKEGGVRAAGTIMDIWRGDPWPREVLLLDNDFFGQSEWRSRIREMVDGRFRVSFNQGINSRFLTDETAEAIAAVDYRDGAMEAKRLHTAWDSKSDEDRFFAGLRSLTKYGVKPDHIMVYMLIGYWPGETPADRDYRRAKLRDFGCRPYPMPYVRTPELVGFQRWVVGAYDKPRKDSAGISWEQWRAAGYRPENLARDSINATLYP